MKSRRKSLMSLACAVVALGVMIAPALASELIGRITKVDVDSKTLLVTEKDTDLEIKVKVNDKTVAATRKGEQKVDLEKVKEALEKATSGIAVTITHQKGVASKITYTPKGVGQRKLRDSKD